jgi:hypothetical protein
MNTPVDATDLSAVQVDRKKRATLALALHNL